MTAHGTAETKTETETERERDRETERQRERGYAQGSLIHSHSPVENSDDVQEVLHSELAAACRQVATDNGGDVLGVAYADRKVRAAPNMEVKEEVSHQLPVLLVVVA